MIRIDESIISNNFTFTWLTRNRSRLINYWGVLDSKCWLVGVHRSKKFAYTNNIILVKEKDVPQDEHKVLGTKPARVATRQLAAAMPRFPIRSKFRHECRRRWQTSRLNIYVYVCMQVDVLASCVHTYRKP